MVASAGVSISQYNGGFIMVEFTQKQLRELVKEKVAIDITDHGDKEYEETMATEDGKLRRIGYSHGAYGLSGLLMKGEKTGKIYAITSRSTAIFIYA